MAKDKKLLLISNSYPFGGEYLDHAKEAIGEFLKDVGSVLFIPYALTSRDEYLKQNRDFFKELGINLSSIHQSKKQKEVIEKAEAIFIGGGNTFRLLKELQEKDLLKHLKEKIEKGTPYIGSSAGVHMVTPSIRTTNDMPITELPNFEAMAIVNFQINPHYIDADPKSTHMGETREKRLEQFHEESELTIVGLREGSWLKIENRNIYLGGKSGAKVFKKGKPAKEYKPGSYIKSI